tara:strand:+ start:7536 stop:7727 length:192 start_codon:yes stop_codon:yes gene_type:complete
MTLKTFKKIDKKGREETWEWEETPELLAALEKLNESSQLAASLKERKQTPLKTPNVAPSKSKA